jgi:hypothetical protein
VSERLWILLGAGGEVAAQIVGDDTDRDNPDALPAIEVDRHGDLAREAWDAEAGCWVPRLDVLKAEAWERVKARRAESEYGGAETPLGRMDSDPASQGKINGLVTMAMLAQAGGQPFAQPFTMADNQVVEHDAAAMIAAGVAVGRHVAACHTAARTLREAIEAAATAGELAAIDIETASWPGSAN